MNEPPLSRTTDPLDQRMSTLLRTSGQGIGWALLIVIAAAFFLMALRDLQLWLRLSSEGEMTEAAIVDRIEGSREYIIVYQFDAQTPDGEGRSIQQQEEVNWPLWTYLADRDNTTVRYDPRNPTISRIYGNYNFACLLPGGILGLVVGVALAANYLKKRLASMR